jgi:hypothetical protein
MARGGFRQQVVLALHDAIIAHEEGRLEEIGAAYDRLFAAASAEQNVDPELQVAVDFLDSWSDSSKHGWALYEPIGRDDWPKLAGRLAVDLDSSTPIDATLRERFTFAPRLGLWAWLGSVFRGSA